MKFTQKVVDNLTLPAGKRDVTIWDDECPGLMVRLQGKARRWVVRYRPKGESVQRTVTLGPLAGLSLKKAREAAVGYTAAAKKGTDIVREERAKAEAEKQAQEEQQRISEAESGRRLGVIAEAYMAAAEKTLRPGTTREIRRYLERHWRPLHDHVADQLDRRTIVARLDAITKESGPTAANRAKAYLSMALAWGVERGLLDANPCVGLKMPNTERPRDRVLSEAEIKLLWGELGPGDFGDIMKALLLTAQRREEVASMRWAELDLDKALWTLPAARSKNGREHLVPLSEPVLAMLRDRKARRDIQLERDLEQGIRRQPRPLVFGVGSGGFSGFGLAKARLDAALATKRAQVSGIPEPNEEDLAEHALPAWTIHDLRRTAITHMAEMGIQPHVIEAIVNHVSGHKAGVAGIYNRALYMPERQKALQAWADHVAALVSGREPASNVVVLRG